MNSSDTTSNEIPDSKLSGKSCPGNRQIKYQCFRLNPDVKLLDGICVLTMYVCISYERVNLGLISLQRRRLAMTMAMSP